MTIFTLLLAAAMFSRDGAGPPQGDICSGLQQGNRKYREAITMFENGNYPEANVLFKDVIQSLDELPVDLAYYFAATSFHLGAYKRCINWLNKHLALQGTQSKFYKSAVEYLALAEIKFLEETRDQQSTYLQQPATWFETCEGSSRIPCIACKGKRHPVAQGQTRHRQLQHVPLMCRGGDLGMRGVPSSAETQAEPPASTKMRKADPALAATKKQMPPRVSPPEAFTEPEFTFRHPNLSPSVSPEHTSWR